MGVETTRVNQVSRIPNLYPNQPSGFYVATFNTSFNGTKRALVVMGVETTRVNQVRKSALSKSGERVT